MLSAVSEGFAGMFRSGMREAQTGMVRVKGVSRQSFKGFLEWVYLGEVSPPAHCGCLLRALLGFWARRRWW